MWCKFSVIKLIVITFIALFSGCHDIPNITTKHLKPGIMLSSFQNESFTYVLPSSFADIDWYYFLDEKMAEMFLNAICRLCSMKNFRSILTNIKKERCHEVS